MESPAVFFFTSGKLAPRPFACGILAVYVLSFLSQVLISPPVTARWGVWIFTLVQIAVIWTWFALHAKRLRDAGLPAGSALPVAILYALALVLLVLLIEPIIGTNADPVVSDMPRMRFADLWIVLLLVEAFAGQARVGFFDVLALVMLALILTPIVIALGFSVWVGTRPQASAADAS
jgi:uncharacterized membrane protein YhaH (DUF805 family)